MGNQLVLLVPLEGRMGVSTHQRSLLVVDGKGEECHCVRMIGNCSLEGLYHYLNRCLRLRMSLHRILDMGR